MPIPLNAEMLAAAYDYLCAQRPFSAWNLPPSEEVKFSVIRNKDRYAHYQFKKRHCIAVSARNVGRHEMLISTLAHEIIHLYMRIAGIGGDPHGAAFQKLADKVCEIHEFDRLIF